jgi:crossover junction endodeoxyribonuclease RusA
MNNRKSLTKVILRGEDFHSFSSDENSTVEIIPLDRVTSMPESPCFCLEVPGEPVSKARHRFGWKGIVYTPTKTRQGEQKLKLLFKVKYRTWKPSSSLLFGVRLVFECETYRRRDIDNMIKLVLDAGNDLIWADDTQVLEVAARIVRKSSQPRTLFSAYAVGSKPGT